MSGESTTSISDQESLILVPVSGESTTSTSARRAYYFYQCQESLLLLSVPGESTTSTSARRVYYFYQCQESLLLLPVPGESTTSTSARKVYYFYQRWRAYHCKQCQEKAQESLLFIEYCTHYMLGGDFTARLEDPAIYFNNSS